MKILREGRLKEAKFMCRACGCIFTANEREYDRRYWHLQNMNVVPLITCCCPVCGNTVEGEEIMSCDKVDYMGKPEVR